MMSGRFPHRIAPLAAFFAIVLLASAPLASAQEIQGSFDRTLKVAGAVDLTIQSGSGQITVQPGAAGSVRVVARLRSSGSWTASKTDIEQRIRKIEQNPPITQQGGTIKIGFFEDSDLQRDISISYDVTVPAGAKVAARSGSGGIVIGALKSTVDVSTGSGSIQVDGAAGLKARTGSGSIKASAIAGGATVSTGSGGITMAQTGPGDVTASSGSGSITLTGVSGAAKVSAASGGITIDGRMTAPWSLNSSSGGVTVTLPPDAAFDVDAHCSSGSVSTTHPVTTTGEMDRRRIAGKVRGGGPLLKVTTSSGSIKIQ